MQPDAEVRLPADSAYVAVLRMTTAGIAARLDFTLDDIEDLRMAVGEASAMLLERARQGGQLITQYFLGESRVAVRISVDAVQPTPPETNSFAWQVLTALTTRATAEVTPAGVGITLSMKSALLA